jgi:hypothetical protein
MGLRADVDTEVRGKILCLCRGSNLDSPVVQPVARHYTDWASRLTITITRVLNVVSIGGRKVVVSFTVKTVLEIYVRS